MDNEFINHDIENLALIGGPGTGKTKLIIDYCINKFNKYQKKFLIITFSNKAINDIINKGNQIQKIFTTTNVKTINLLATNIYKSLFNKTSTSTNTIILALYKSLLNLDISLNSINYLNNYNFIIIDEAQDINENQYNLIKLISNKLNIPLILVGDPNQHIYQFQGSGNKYLLNHTNKIIYLSENFRSSGQIVDFTNYLKPNSLLMVPTKNNGIKPIIYSKSINNILNNIIKELNKKIYNLKDIAIIGPIKKMKYNGLDLELITNHLDKNNIKYIVHYTNNNTNTNEYIDDHVNILTCHGSKGLEFKKVLIINYSIFSKIETKQQYNDLKYLWYVALTRAQEELIIYIDKNIFPEILNVPTILYNINGKLDVKTDINFKSDINLINEIDYINFNFNYKIKTEKLYEIENIIEYNNINKLFIYYYKNNNIDNNENNNIELNNIQDEIKNINNEYLENINLLSKKYTNLKFNIPTKHNHLNLEGMIDILQGNKIIKFINNIDIKYIIEVLLNYNNLFNDWSVDKELELWNLHTGIKYIIYFDNTLTNWKLNCYICKLLNIKMNNNIFLLDLETNTKDESIPFTEPSNVEIIDRYVYEYNLKSCVSDGLIKCQTELKPFISQLTGITNEELKNGDNNTDKFKLEMKNIMKYCNKPIFIAHNGFRFDFNILFYYNILNKEQINILDSMLFLKLFIHNLPSNKLIDIYNHVCTIYNNIETNAIQSHRAQGDTIMIDTICRKINLTFIDFNKMIN